MSDETPYGDPFNDQAKRDPFEDDQFANRNNSNNRAPISVPNAGATLTLGILSIVGSFCYGILGLIFAIIALAIAAGPTREYRANPGMYTDSSFSTLKAGKICALIGLILSIVVLLFFAVALLFLASEKGTPFEYRSF